MSSIRIYIIVSVFFIQGCAFVPKEFEESKVVGSCKLESKKYTLDLEMADCLSAGGDGAALCLLGSVVTGSVTFVVSGTIVVVANTVHWLERKYKCSDDEIEKGRKEFLDQMNEINKNDESEEGDVRVINDR